MNSELSITVALTRGLTAVTLSGTLASPLTGEDFGFRHNRSERGGFVNDAAESTIDDENLEVAVPEPATLLLPGLAGLTMGCRHRCRQRQDVARRGAMHTLDNWIALRLFSSGTFGQFLEKRAGVLGPPVRAVRIK